MDLRINGIVSDDVRLLVDLPTGTPSGAVEVIVRSKREHSEVELRNLELLRWLRARDVDPKRRARTREGVDASLQVERDAWE